MTFFSRNLKTYTGAITNKAVTEHMARKLSGSSLKLEDLAKVVKFYGLDTKMGKQESQKPKLLSKNYSIILIRNMLHFYFLLTWSIEELMIVIWCLKVPQNIFLNNNFSVSDWFIVLWQYLVMVSFSHLEDDDSVMSLE